MEVNPESREGYYRSLTERFTTDLFETLIRQNFGGRDRWTAFDERKLNLYSIGIFNKDRLEDVPTDRQPMLYSILFHDQEPSSKKNDPIHEMLENVFRCVSRTDKEISDATKSQITKVFMPLFRSIIKAQGGEAVHYLENLCNRYATKSPEAMLTELKNRLELEFASNTQNEEQYPEITAEYYSNRCSSNKLNSCDPEEVCKHLEMDIDILGSILIKAAIPAIQIDKTFVYYVVRSIENILNSIESEQSGKFNDFIAQNFEKIACSQLSDMNAEAKKRNLRCELCSDIQKILLT